MIKLPGNVSVQEALDLYEQDPDVLYAEPNYILTLTPSQNYRDAQRSELWQPLGAHQDQCAERVEYYHRQQYAWWR